MCVCVCVSDGDLMVHMKDQFDLDPVEDPKNSRQEQIMDLTASSPKKDNSTISERLWYSRANANHLMVPIWRC